MIVYDEYANHLDEWEKMDKMFRFRWWSPIFLVKYYFTTRAVAKEVRKITSRMPKPRIKP